MDRFWFVTWTTYGSWLPGDPRGFRTRRGHEYVPPPARYAKDGEPVYDPRQYSERYRASRTLVPAAVKLNAEEIRLAQLAIVEEIGSLAMRPLILAVGATHFHLISQFHGIWIRPTVGRLKAAATRALPNPGTRKRLWTKECHMESLNTDAALEQAVDYVRRHRDQGALIHEWDLQAVRLAVGDMRRSTP